MRSKAQQCKAKQREAVRNRSERSKTKQRKATQSNAIFSNAMCLTTAQRQYILRTEQCQSSFWQLSNAAAICWQLSSARAFCWQLGYARAFFWQLRKARPFCYIFDIFWLSFSSRGTRLWGPEQSGRDAHPPRNRGQLPPDLATDILWHLVSTLKA